MITAERFALLTGPHTCYKCGQATNVSAIGLVGFIERDDEHGDVHVDHCVLHTQIARLNDDALQAISARSPWLQFDHSNTANATYLANHCQQCDAMIGAWFIKEPGEVFFPLTDAEVARLTVEWFDQAIEIDDLGGKHSSWIDDLLAPDRERKPVRRKRSSSGCSPSRAIAALFSSDFRGR